MKIAIQGELGSNSHMAALAMFKAEGVLPHIVACAVSREVIAKVIEGSVEGAVLPIENSLHGSVAEHYDLFLHQAVRVDRESLLRIRHNVIVCPGVAFEELRRVLSHPVALAQCRRFLEEHSNIQVVPFYDTAGAVKHVLQEGLRDTAAIAPALAAQQYGGEVLREGVEDHAENLTRFHLVRSNDEALPDNYEASNKMSVAFAIEHRPGTLVGALQALREVGVDLTKIESRPVPGRPWEYVFYVDVRFATQEQAEGALAGLKSYCRMVKELGRYVAA